LAHITANDVEETPRGMMWRVYSSKTKKTRKIPVRPEVAELSRRLMKTAPAGSGYRLFRNPEGNRWLEVTGVWRFIRIARSWIGARPGPQKIRLVHVPAYVRASHAVGYWNGGAGCSIETLAELIGDTPRRVRPLMAKNGSHIRTPVGSLWGLGGRAYDGQGKGPGTRSNQNLETDENPKK